MEELPNLNQTIKTREDYSCFLPRLITVDQTCQYLNVGPIKVLSLVEQNLLEMVHIGRMSRILAPSVARYIETLPRGIKDSDRKRMSAVSKGLTVAERV